MPRPEPETQLGPQSETTEKPEWLTPTEAGWLIGVSSERIRQLAKSGELPYFASPLGRLFRTADVEALIASREAAARPVTIPAWMAKALARY